jgi:hypothetical protein
MKGTFMTNIQGFGFKQTISGAFHIVAGSDLARARDRFVPLFVLKDLSFKAREDIKDEVALNLIDRLSGKPTAAKMNVKELNGFNLVVMYKVFSKTKFASADGHAFIYHTLLKNMTMEDVTKNVEKRQMLINIASYDDIPGASERVALTSFELLARYGISSKEISDIIQKLPSDEVFSKLMNLPGAKEIRDTKTVAMIVDRSVVMTGNNGYEYSDEDIDKAMNMLKPFFDLKLRKILMQELVNVNPALAARVIENLFGKPGSSKTDIDEATAMVKLHPDTMQTMLINGIRGSNPDLADGIQQRLKK